MFRFTLTIACLAACPAAAQDAPPSPDAPTPLVLPWMLLPPQSPAATPVAPVSPVPPASGHGQGCQFSGGGHTA